MRLLASRFLVTTIFIFLALPQLTFAWTKDYSYEHKMGDNDSRNLAKEAAVEQIKLKAAQEAGTYIQGTTTLTNGQLEETITQIGASIVKIVVQADKISVDEAGHQLLTVTANATVDEAVMQERIKALQEDANKAKLLQQLTSENEKLRAEMTALAQQRAQELDSQKLATIVAREATLRKDLATNLTSTEQVFKSVVSAIDIANQEALILKNEFDKIEAEWDLKFFQPMMKPKIIQADVVNMKLSDSGQYYEGIIVIKWQNDPNKDVEQFICQQQSSICKAEGIFSYHDGYNGKLLKDHLLFSFPPSMSWRNKSRFLQMMMSKQPIYYIQYSLANRTDFVQNHSLYGLMSGFENKRYIDKWDNHFAVDTFTVYTAISEEKIGFAITVDEMKNNPILNVEVITPEQYQNRKHTKENFNSRY